MTCACAEGKMSLDCELLLMEKGDGLRHFTKRMNNYIMTGVALGLDNCFKIPISHVITLTIPISSLLNKFP